MPNDSSSLDTVNNIKTIKLFIHETAEKLSLTEYLKSISDLTFSTHSSEMRYGETYYFRGNGTNIRALIVPTITLSKIPRQYRKQDWFYVKIYCLPDDMRFDTFPDYECAAAHQYNI